MSAAGDTKPKIDDDALIRTATDGLPVLRGGRCPECRTPHFPKQPVCPVCAGEKIAAWDMPRTGLLYSFSVLHVGNKDGKPRAYGYVDLANGVRIFARLKGTEHQIGERVYFQHAQDHGENEPEFIFTTENPEKK